MKTVFVWDPLVRLFHWSLVAAFVANAVLTDDESKLHEIVGYVALSLIGIRIVWGLVGTRYARFSSFPPDVPGAIGQIVDVVEGKRHIHIGHTPLGALMIYNLLLAIAGIGVTGWMMTTHTWFGIAWVEEAHEVLVLWAEISVVAHIAAVMFESWRTRVNLPKAMLTGYKTLPGDQAKTP